MVSTRLFVTHLGPAWKVLLKVLHKFRTTSKNIYLEFFVSYPSQDPMLSASRASVRPGELTRGSLHRGDPTNGQDPFFFAGSITWTHEGNIQNMVHLTQTKC